jgi:hypothetical protein
MLSDLSDAELIEYHRLFSVGKSISTRFESRKTHNADVKFMYHIVRLLDQAEQVLLEGDLDLQRNREELKAIRRGEWTEEYLREIAAERERGLEEVYKNSKLRHSPDEQAIKKLLLDCLEEHYGDLSACIVNVDRAVVALRNIRDELDRVQSLL